ncbi:MAG: DUF6580 family putative transport protein [Patescibacteria group bacterium]
MNLKIYFYQNKLKILGAILLVVFGIFARFFRIHFFPELPNVEPITICTLLAGAFLGGGYALFVPLVIIAITDMTIGNTSILYFTWSAWAIIGLFSLIVRKSNKKSFSFGFKMAGLGVCASLFFYLWTNFGVWLISGMYPHTLSGLIWCYIIALPFLKLNLFGNLIIVSVGSFVLVITLRIYKSFKIYKFKYLKFIEN